MAKSILGSNVHVVLADIARKSYGCPSAKLTVIVVSTSTGWPFSTVGLYFQVLTVSMTPGRSSGFEDVINDRFFMDPSVLIVAFRMTLPSMRAVNAKGGYGGAGLKITLPACTSPLIRIGEDAPAVWTAGGASVDDIPPTTHPLHPGFGRSVRWSSAVSDREIVVPAFRISAVP